MPAIREISHSPSLTSFPKIVPGHLHVADSINRDEYNTRTFCTMNLGPQEGGRGRGTRHRRCAVHQGSFRAKH